MRGAHVLHVQGVRSPQVLRGGPTAECLPGTEGTGLSDSHPQPEPAGQMIQDADLIPVDLLSRPFRNSPPGGTSRAAGRAALAFLGEMAELMSYT